MRHPITTLILTSAILLAVIGCEDRQNMRVTPNRDGHAYFDPTKQPNVGMNPQANEGEIYYNVAAGDTITSIAKHFKMTNEEFIKRNELKNGRQPRVGEQVIVRDPKINP